MDLSFSIFIVLVSKKTFPVVKSSRKDKLHSEKLIKNELGKKTMFEGEQDMDGLTAQRCKLMAIGHLCDIHFRNVVTKQTGNGSTHLCGCIQSLV